MATGVVSYTVDERGNSYRLGDSIGDFLLPAFLTIPDFLQHTCNVREMTMNPDDVIIVGFPKTGCHWMSSVVHMLKEGSTDTYVTEGLGDLLGVLLDKTPITPQTVPPADRPRFFFSHLRFHRLPRQVLEKKVKVIYLQRNPKDTWVSWYNHAVRQEEDRPHKGLWDQFFDLMISPAGWYGNWFDFVLDWERDIDKGREVGMPILINSYEDLKKDPVVQIQKLDQFLGYNRGRELCEQIAQACQFSTMKSALREQWKGSNSNSINPLAFYRKGKVGDWKNWFTVTQNEAFARVYKEKMKGSTLRYTFE